MVSRREGTGWITASHSPKPQGVEPSAHVHGQQLAGVEHKPLGSAGQLKEVDHSAVLAADLDDVAALHAGRSDLDGGEHDATGYVSSHLATSAGTS
jgi:hypothetical protein